jgi:nucleoside-diphosphate-sugar epimerase
MAVLVTGGTGFTGVNIVRDLAEAGNEVVSVDAIAPDSHALRFLQPYYDRVVWVQGDLRNPSVFEAIGRDHPIDRIVHAAAYSPYDQEEAERFRFVIDNNLGSLLNVIDFAKTQSVRRLIAISSIGVYTSPEFDEPTRDLRILETQAPHPDHVYGISKVAEEGIVARAGELFGFDGLSVRMSQNWGPMERTTPYHSKISIPHYWAHQAAAGEPIEASPVGFGQARGRRLNQDQAYITDTAAAIRALLDAPELTHSVYNVSSGGPVFLDDLVNAMRAAVPGVRFGEPLEEDNADRSFGITFDTTRLIDDTGWQPRYDLSAALADCVAWIRESGFPSGVIS